MEAAMRMVTNPLGWSRSWTHKKRPYHAHAVQWQGDPEAIRPLVPEAELVHVGEVLMVRFAPGETKVLRPRDWAVRGENNEVKFYSDDIFHVKYEEV